jgi:hypothetical protein
MHFENSSEVIFQSSEASLVLNTINHSKSIWTFFVCKFCIENIRSNVLTVYSEPSFSVYTNVKIESSRFKHFWKVL